MADPDAEIRALKQSVKKLAADLKILRSFCKTEQSIGLSVERRHSKEIKDCSKGIGKNEANIKAMTKKLGIVEGNVNYLAKNLKK